MLTDIKWGHTNENTLYIGAKGVFLKNIHLRILERLERREIPWKSSI